MKNNTFKRVLAGSLALLTVAAYTPVNPVDLLQVSNNAIVADAADAVKSTLNFDDARDYLYSIQDKSTWNESMIQALSGSFSEAEGQEVVLKSKVPLTITATRAKVNDASAAQKVLKLEASIERYDYSSDTDAKNYIVVNSDGTVSPQKDQPTADGAVYVQLNNGVVVLVYNNKVYTNGTPNAAIAGVLFSATDATSKLSEALNKDFYIDTTNSAYTDKIDITSLADINPVNGKFDFGATRSDNTNDEVLTYIQAPLSYSLTVNGNDRILKDDQQKISEEDAKKTLLKENDIETADNTYIDGSTFVIDATTGKVFLAVGLKAIEPERAQPDSDGIYTYTYTAPNDKAGGSAVTVTAETIKYNAGVDVYTEDGWSATAKTKDGTASDAAGYNWTDLKFGDVTVSGFASGAIAQSSGPELVVGSDVVITNSKPFAVYVTQNTETTTPTVSYDSTNKKFTATFKVSPTFKPGDNKNFTISLVKKEPKYTFALNNAGTALIAKNSLVGELEAASMNVKYYDNGTSSSSLFPTTGTDKGTAVGSTVVPYGKVIAIKAPAGAEFVDGTTLTIKNGSTEVYRATRANSGATSWNATTNTINAAYASSGDVIYFTGKAGSYTVTYTVKNNKEVAEGKTENTYTITKSFSVDTKGKLTASNVKLEVTAKTKNTNTGAFDQDVANIATVIDATASNGKASGNTFTVQCESGKDIEIILADGKKLEDYQFTVTPKITGNDKENVTDFTSTTRTVDGKNRLRIAVNDSEYKETTDDIDIFYQFYDANARPQFVGNGLNLDPVVASVEDLETLGQEILAKAATNDVAKALTTKDVEFEYIAGIGADRINEEDLDAYESGLPSAKGEYTAYVLYNGEVKAAVRVKLIAHKASFNPDSSALSITYGKDFTVDTYNLLDATGKKIKNLTVSELSVQFMQPKYKYESGSKVAKTGEYEAYGATTTLSGTVNNKTQYEAEVAKDLGFAGTINKNTLLADTTRLTALETPAAGSTTADFTFGNGIDLTKEQLVSKIGKLNAGTYYVKFSGKLSSEDYAFTSEVYTLTVSKKSLSDENVKINIKPATYTGSVLRPTKDDISAKDADTGVDITNKLILDSSPRKTDVGSYAVVIALDKDVEQNYEGTATPTWSVVSKESNIATNLKWNVANTTLYGDKDSKTGKVNNRIHVEITKDSLDKIKLPSGVTIEYFGVLLDNTGKIPAPSFNTSDYKYGFDYTGIVGNNANGASNAQKDVYNAEQQLQYGNDIEGNGYIFGKYDATGTTLADGTKVNANSTTYKANIKVKGVDIGIWARPVVVFSDGTVAYGTVRYINMENEAKQKLNLKMPYDSTSAVVRQADLTDTEKKNAQKYVNAGYDPLQNRAYAYATFTDLATAGFPAGSVLEVSDFGVVLENKGAIPAPADPDSVKADELAVAKKKLQLNADGVIAGHYKKGNKNLAGDNEYTANIKTINSETGVWVAPYLDLGDGLVVYGDPIYVKSASEYFKDAVAHSELQIAKKESSNSVKLSFTPNDQLSYVQDKIKTAYKNGATGRNKADAPEVKIVEAGIVIDRAGVLKVDETGADNWHRDTDYYKNVTSLSTSATKVADAITYAADVYPTATTKMLQGDTNFVTGKKTTNFATAYNGTVATTNKDGKPVKDLIAKEFVTYSIGTGDSAINVTLYGAPQAYFWNGTTWFAPVKNTKS